MARKIKMNFFETYVEKFAMALAVICLLAVLYFGVMNPSNIDGKDPLTAANDALATAKNAVSELETPGGNDIEVRDAKINIEEIMDQGDITEYLANIGITPWQVYLGESYNPNRTKIRLALIGDTAELKDARIQFTRADALVPEEKTDVRPTVMGGMEMNAATATKSKSIDFVSIEATFDMQAWRNEFTKRLTGPDVQSGMLDETFTVPVVAVVELVRHELAPDGQWSESVIVSRLKGDPMEKAPTAAQLMESPSSVLKVKISETTDSMQLSMLQPEAYKLVGPAQWNPLSGTQESSASRRRDRRGRDNQVNTAGMGMDMGMDMGMMGMDMGMGGGMGGVRNTADSAAAKVEFAKNNMPIWAHDDTVQPGHAYRYQMRVAFFNPIFEHKFFIAQQEEIKNERLLWTNLAEPTNLILIPPRTIHYPKIATKDKKNTKVARFEVAHYHGKKWRTKSFEVAIGSEIGGVVEETISASRGRNDRDAAANAGMGMGAAATTGASGKQEVDYCTGAVLLDIIPDSVHWIETGSRTLRIVCTDVVFRQADGTVVRLGSDKKTWPADFAKLQRMAR